MLDNEFTCECCHLKYESTSFQIKPMGKETMTFCRQCSMECLKTVKFDGRMLYSWSGCKSDTDRIFVGRID